VGPVDLYVRVSRVGGRENLISPDEQERRGRDLAAAQGLTVGEIITDLDESGGKWERPGLQRALMRVEQGKSAGVIVAWLDRLSRDSEHAHALVRRITEAGGKIYAPDAPADWTTPEGGLQAGILFEFAAYVRKRAGASFERAKEQAIARGIPVHSRPPVGYRARADRRLELDPDTAPVVRMVFEARRDGAGPTELAELLERHGVTTSQGSRTWSKEAVYGLLRNRSYLGEISYGLDRRFVNEAAHEPLVDVATFQLAQRRTGRVTSRERAHLLSGLLRCNGCRHCLQGTNDSHGNPVYRCKRRHAGGLCPDAARMRAEPVEAAVLADLWKHLPRPRVSGKRDRGGRLAVLARTAERERAALAEWASPTVQAEIGDLALYADGLRERRDRVTAAETMLAAEQQLQASAHALPTGMSWRSAWDAMSIADRAALLATRYDCIRLGRNPDLLIVYPVGVGPVDLPRQGFRRDPVIRGFEADVPDGARVLAL
jgi:DNA invertase Pin-like site-specific DNA recombinase